ncbi:MAG: TIGR02594 family protein [Flavobacteriales bacterium]|nr:TIGR02594 family protein [Flavobacteriales bacterium]
MFKYIKISAYLIYLTHISAKAQLSQNFNKNRDLFKLHIDYLSQSSYSGLPNEILWHNGLVKKKYVIAYDKTGQIVQSEYFSDEGDHTFDLDTVVYDFDGKPTQIIRNHSMSSGSSDNLLINYESTHINKVEELGDSIIGFIGTNALYAYDMNGNMEFDGSKELQIQYNSNNQPIKMISNGDTMIIQYLANGIRFKELIMSSSSVSSVSKWSDFQYQNGTIDFVMNGSGRSVFNNGFKNEYFINDHLGSLRVSFCDLNENNKLESNEVLQRKDYYPFGMAHPEDQIIGQENLIGFNGKENIKPWDLYDFHQRLYDPSTMQWQSPDPHAENYLSWSPYQFVGNSPFYLTDPTGMDWYVASEGESKPVWLPDEASAKEHYGKTEYVNLGGNLLDVFQTNTEETESSGQEIANYLNVAQNYLGEKEIPGSEHNENVVLFHQSTQDGKGNSFQDDEAAWCASFVNYCISNGGYDPNENKFNATATSYKIKSSNTSSVNASWGSVGVYSRKGYNHVTFIIGKDPSGKYYYGLGGNQGKPGQVKISKYPKKHFVSFRLPNAIKNKTIPIPTLNL